MATEGTPTLRRRRLWISANVLVQIAFVLALVVMANWLVSRHYTRFDWTKSSYYKLSEKTGQVLRGLKDPLKIIVFLPPDDRREYVAKTLEDVRNLLKEFQLAGGDKLRIDYVDPERDLARAEQLVQEYQLDSRDLIIFVSGPRHKYVKVDDLVEFEQGMYGEAPRIKAFKGEGVFLSAIQTVLEETPPRIYFVTGHGERDSDSSDERQGYSMLSTYIKRDNITVAKWNLAEKQAPPTDAGVIVIAGPRRPFTEAEISQLDQYLKNHGRLLVMLDPQQKSGLEEFLLRWGVQVDNDLVVSVLLGMINVTALGDAYAPHPITARLDGVNTSFPYARSVRRAETAQKSSADQPKVTELIKTPSTFWGETNPESEHVQFDPGNDVPGPMPLAVAVEAGMPQGANVDIGVTRMVIVGCSRFVDNSDLGGGNIDFVMNTLNWLLQRQQLIAVGPKVPEEFHLDMSPPQVRAVNILVTVGLPLAVAFLGLFVWTARRK